MDFIIVGAILLSIFVYYNSKNKNKPKKTINSGQDLKKSNTTKKNLDTVKTRKEDVISISNPLLETRVKNKEETEELIKLLISKFENMELSSNFNVDQKKASIKKWKLLFKLSKLPRYSNMNIEELTKLDLKMVSKILDKDIRPWRYERQRIHMSHYLKEEYLKSDDWHNLKAKRLKIANNRCEVENCSNTQSLQLHHVHYSNLGNEDLDDVRIVCMQCHESIHNKLGYKRTEFYHI